MYSVITDNFKLTPALNMDVGITERFMDIRCAALKSGRSIKILYQKERHLFVKDATGAVLLNWDAYRRGKRKRFRRLASRVKYG